MFISCLILLYYYFSQITCAEAELLKSRRKFLEGPAIYLSRHKRSSTNFNLASWLSPKFSSSEDQIESSTSKPLGISISKDFSCGKPAINPQTAISKSVNKIVGGTTAIPHSLPWQISLQKLSGFHFCGGSLIHPKFILTAAHCVESTNPKDLQVVLGAHDRSYSESSQIKVSVEKITSHPKFESTQDALYNDFAILTLSKPINFTNYVSPICIGSKPPAAGTECIVSGWGTMYYGGSTTTVLQQVVIPLYNNTQCNDAKHYHGLIDDSVICAGFENGGKDSCQGDSGGPLACFDSSSWYLVGVVSYGKDCALINKPGIYSRISYVYDWIVQQINEK